MITAATKLPHRFAEAMLALVVLATLACAAQAGTPPLKEEARASVLRAAGDAQLPTWQRDFMRGLASEDHTTAQTGDEPLTADGAWTAVALAPPPTTLPAGRAQLASIYDPVRDRMIVFGGFDGSTNFNDVWALSLSGLPTWTMIAPSGTPPSARRDHSGVYDPVRDRLVVFGGYDGGYLNDVWVLSLAGTPQWSSLAVGGTKPPGRYAHGAIYDQAQDAMVIYGGGNRTSYFDDTWKLSFAGTPTWTLIVPSGQGPPARIYASGAFDAARERMIVFSGLYAGTTLDDTWALSLGGTPSWSELTPDGIRPSARYGTTTTYDPVRDRLVAFGGVSGVGGTWFNDTWQFDLASLAWSQQSPTGTLPAPRVVHTMVFDSARDRILIFGGDPGYGSPYLNDTWALPFTGTLTWSLLQQTALTPAGRAQLSSIYDPVRQQFVIFGGYDGTDNYADVWALSLGSSATWSQVYPSGTRPTARRDHSAIYDPVRDRMIVFGGYDNYTETFLNDVWSLSLGTTPTWTQLAPTGTPPPGRYAHGAVYDPIHDVMFIFGGGNRTLYFNDVWALRLGGTPAWRRLKPAGTLPARRLYPTVAFNEARSQLVMFAGLNHGVPFNDAWTLNLVPPSWTRLEPAGTPPAARYGNTGVFDVVRNRLVIFAGVTAVGGPFLNDSWELSLDSLPAWRQLAPTGDLPTARAIPTSSYDGSQDRMLVFGGDPGYGTPYLNDTWSLSWAGSLSNGPPPPIERRPDDELFLNDGLDGEQLEVGAPFGLRGVLPNPAQGQFVLYYSIDASAPSSVTIVDASGREVQSHPLNVAERTRGSLTMILQRELPNGIYLVRLVQGNRTAATRVVLTR